MKNIKYCGATATVLILTDANYSSQCSGIHKIIFAPEEAG